MHVSAVSQPVTSNCKQAAKPRCRQLYALQACAQGCQESMLNPRAHRGWQIAPVTDGAVSPGMCGSLFSSQIITFKAFVITRYRDESSSSSKCLSSRSSLSSQELLLTQQITRAQLLTVSTDSKLLCHAKCSRLDKTTCTASVLSPTAAQ